jgi:hypothetical protein
VRRASRGARFTAAALVGLTSAGRAQQPVPAAPRPAVPVPGPPVDSAARASVDSVRGLADSLNTPPVRRDSIQPPIARAELPVGVAVGPAYRYRGDSVLASGALTLLDFLERVPGVTGFRSGYIASAQTAAYNGDFRRVRVFRDGVELDPIDPRGGGVLDLVDVPIWQAEELAVEVAAGEIRVHLRTRTVRNRTPLTRVDIATGDDETNLYRAFYGKRFGNGGLIQINAQQFGSGSRNRRVGGGGDAVNAVVRLGWARRGLSVDALLTRLQRRRNETLDFLTQAAVLPRAVGRRDEGYLRVGLGDPERGVWAQAIANLLEFRNESPARATTSEPTVSADTSRYRAQYVLTGGLSYFGVRVSAAGRARVFDGRTDLAPSVRASFDRPWLSVSALAERAGLDSSRRVDASARLAPLRRLAFVGGVSHTQSDAVIDNGTRNVFRAEVAAQLGGAWLSAGRIVRDGGALLPPVVYEDALASARPARVRELSVGGTIAGLRGRVYRDLQADVSAVLWDSAGTFRPRYQGRAELRLLTNWLSRFPSGEFGANVAVFDEYRSEMYGSYTSTGAGTAGSLIQRRAAASNQLGALLELRLQSAVLSFQIRNALGRRFEYLPGLRAPQALSIYGVRWEFSN